MSKKDPELQDVVLQVTMPRYKDYNIPQGFLRDTPACHALFHYAVIAMNNYQMQHETIKYEHELEQEYNYHQLMKSIGFAYGVKPEQMIRYWREVSMQFKILGFPEVPESLRQDKPYEIKMEKANG